ncbi:MAG TPA: MFS transporter [Mycobacteriales bacterium]|nr:MFS transporter [Mycobacteriales bacterium]
MSEQRTSAGPVTSGPVPAAASAARRSALTLAVIVTCQLMVVLDASVVNIALPDIRTALHFSDTSLSWVISAYTLTFGGLLLLGGRAGDILGRRRVFLSGLALFTAASLAGGLATSPAWLLTARAIQGVGAAIASPNTLSLIMSNFEGNERTRAIGIYSATSAAGGSIGLIAGGMLTDWVSWRWILFINVPIGLALLVLGPRHIREPERHPGRFDLSGAILSTSGMSLLVYGFIRAASDGWRDTGTTLAFVAAILVLTGFILREMRAAQPILPLRLLRHRNRAGSYLNMLLLPAAMFGMFYFATLFLQDVKGFSPLRNGIAFLPMTLVLFVTARIVPRLLPRTGAKPLMIIGGVLVVTGMLWLSQLSDTTSYSGGVLGPIMLFGVGAAMSFVSMSVTILSEVARPDAGAASGMLQTMQQIGGSLGVAVLTTVFASARPHHPVLHPLAATASAMGDAMSAAAIFCAVALVVASLVITTGKRGTSSGSGPAAQEAPAQPQPEPVG